MKDVFYISGTKELIFRREGNIYVSFDPLSLTFLKLNLIAAEILFLISEKNSYDKILNYFCRKYHIDVKQIANDIEAMLEGYRCRSVILNIIKELNFPINMISKLEKA